MFRPLLESSILSDLRRDSLPGQGNNVEEKKLFSFKFFHLVTSVYHIIHIYWQNSIKS